MSKWILNLILLFVGIVLLLLPADLTWADRLTLGPGLTVAAFFAFLLLKIVPLFDGNWTFFVLSILGCGVALNVPLEPKFQVAIGGGILAIGDLIYRFVDVTPDVEQEFGDWFSRGANLKFLFVPIPGCLIGTAAAIATIFYVR